MVLGLGEPGGDDFFLQRMDHIAVLGVHHHQHPHFAGGEQRIEERCVIDLEDILVRQEEFQAGDAFFDHRGDFLHHFIGEIGDRHVEPIVDVGFPGGLAAPIFKPILQASADRLDGKIDMGGGAAKGGGLLPGKEVIRAACAKEG